MIQGKNISRKKNINKADILMALFCLTFFTFFVFSDGYIIHRDSYAYIEMLDYVEPMYPLFLMFSRTVFTESYYLIIVVIIQSLLMAYAVYSTVKYIKRKFNLPLLFEFGVLAIFIFVSLLCRFASKKGYMYSNVILTEGIAISLFIIFFRNLFEYVSASSYKHLIISALLSFILISTRKQMYLTLGLLIVGIILNAIKNRIRIVKPLITIVVVSVVIFGMCKIFDMSYMKIVNNKEGSHTSDNRFLTTMIFYTADREDGELIKDDEVKELFYTIYDGCIADECVKDKSIKEWYQRVRHFEDSYDEIQQTHLWYPLREYAADKLGNDVNVEIEVDRINGIINKSLLPKVWPEILTTFVDNLLAGFMITISADKSIFAVYSIIAYAVYIMMLGLLIKKKGLTNSVLFSLLVLFSIVGNVTLMSLLIFCQTRYTIYNMALFYISMIIMFYELIGVKHEQKI